jgi:Restriction endonuclease
MTPKKTPIKEKNTGIPYEIMVQRVFQEILDCESVQTIKVQRDVKVRGKSTWHQIDVLWDFTFADIRHLTIVQARDWNQTIKQEAILAFRQVLDDIPGQPRGVFVTRKGFQPGARKFAQDHGIRLFILRQGSPGITLTDISYATMKIEGCRLSNGAQGANLRVTVFRPEPFLQLVLEPGQLLPKLKLDTPRAFQLFNSEKLPIGTFRDVLAEFVATMRANSQLTGEYTKNFPHPTFFRAPRSKRFIQIQSLRAQIDIKPEEYPPFLMKPPGFVDMALEDLDTGKKRSFLRSNAPGRPSPDMRFP